MEIDKPIVFLIFWTLGYAIFAFIKEYFGLFRIKELLSLGCLLCEESDLEDFLFFMIDSLVLFAIYLLIAIIGYNYLRKRE